MFLLKLTHMKIAAIVSLHGMKRNCISIISTVSRNTWAPILFQWLSDNDRLVSGLHNSLYQWSHPCLWTNWWFNFLPSPRELLLSNNVVCEIIQKRCYCSNFCEDAFNISATIPEGLGALQSFNLLTAAATISGLTNIGGLATGSAVDKSSADQGNLIFSKPQVIMFQPKPVSYYHHWQQGFPSSFVTQLSLRISFAW